MKGETKNYTIAYLIMYFIAVCDRQLDWFTVGVSRFLHLGHGCHFSNALLFSIRYSYTFLSLKLGLVCYILVSRSWRYRNVSGSALHVAAGVWITTYQPRRHASPPQKIAITSHALSLSYAAIDHLSFDSSAELAANVVEQLKICRSYPKRAPRHGSAVKSSRLQIPTLLFVMAKIIGLSNATLGI